MQRFGGLGESAVFHDRLQHPPLLQSGPGDVHII